MRQERHTDGAAGHGLLLEYQGGYGVKLDILQKKCVFAAIIPQEKCNGMESFPYFRTFSTKNLQGISKRCK